MRTPAILEQIHLPNLPSHKKMPAAAREIMKQAACLIASLLLSRTVITGGIAPFGIAFCTAVQPKYMISTLVGSCLGVFFAGDALPPYRYMGAVIAAILLSWAVFSFAPKKYRGLLPPVNAFVCCLFTGGLMAFSGGVDMERLLSCLAESILCAGAAFFFYKSLAAISRPRAIHTLPFSEIAPVFISGCILLMSLNLFQLGEFSLARVVSVLVILIAGRYSALAGGALAGVVLGLAMGLSGEELLFLSGVYGVGGLMAGLFSSMGQVGSCSAFFVSALMMLALSGNAGDALPMLLEMTAGCLIFLLLPRKLCSKIDHWFNRNLDLSPSGNLRDSLVVKLRFAGNTMSGISQSIQSVNEKLRELAVPPYGSLSKNLARDICATCNIKHLCWKKESAQTIESFRSLWECARRDGELNEENLPQALEGRCIHTKELIHAYNRQYQAFCRQEQFENEIGHLREIVADQLEGMSDMLFDLSAEFEQAEIYDAELAERLKQLFISYDIYPRDVCCVTDKFQRVRVEVHCPQPVSGLNNRKLHQQVAAVCGRRFEDVHVTFAGHEALLTYCEKPRFALYAGSAQHASGGGPVCGDSIEVFQDGKGHSVLAISDGMGTGPGAAIEGAMASGMLAKLVKAGFGFDCALHTVNSALLVKTGEESLATLDVVSVDLFTGRAEFYKAGASASFLVKEGVAWKVEMPSLPAGILREVEFAKTSAFMGPGDKLVLFSDGVADSETGWLKLFLEKHAGLTCQTLADKVLQAAREGCIGQREDDMTVVVAELHQNRNEINNKK